MRVEPSDGAPFDALPRNSLLSFPCEANLESIEQIENLLFERLM